MPDRADRAELEARLAALKAKRDGASAPGDDQPDPEPTTPPEPPESQGEPPTRESDEPSPEELAKQARLEALHAEMADRVRKETEAIRVETELDIAFRKLMSRIQPGQEDACRRHIESLGLVRVVDGEVCFVDLDADPEPLMAGLRRWLRHDPIASEHFAAALNITGSGDKKRGRAPKPEFLQRQAQKNLQVAIAKAASDILLGDKEQ